MILKSSTALKANTAKSANAPLSPEDVLELIRVRGWRVSKRPVLAMIGLGEYSAGYRVRTVPLNDLPYVGGFTVMVHWENGPPASSYRGLNELQKLQHELERRGYEVDFPGDVLYAKDVRAARI